jgi:small subunit ribosomal protein S1
MTQARPPRDPRRPDASSDPLSAEIDAALEGVRLQDLDERGEARTDAHGGAHAGARGASRGTDPRLKRGTIVGKSGSDVFVELGPRMQGVISISEFDKPPEIGEVFDFSLNGREDDLWKLTRREARAIAEAENVEKGSLVKARVTGQNTGGLELRVGSLAAFMPASQVGLRHEDNLSAYLTQTLVCQVLEVDHDRKRILLSRRAVLEKEREESQKESLGKLSSGQKVRGKVTRIEPFGAFVDLGGGLEGLIHVSNLSRRRVENPREVVTENQEIEVLILEIKDNGKRIGLGRKQLEPDPWVDAGQRIATDAVLNGKVVRLTDFGAFVELEPGLEGLLHVSQMGKERVRRASDVLKVGQELSVRVVAVEASRSRISLSRLDARGAVLGSDEAVDASVIDEAIAQSPTRPIGTNLGNLFKKLPQKPR